MTSPILPGYGPLLLLTTTGEDGTFRTTEPGGRAVVVHTHVPDLPTPAFRERLRRHRDTLAGVHHTGIAPVVAMIDSPSRCALVASAPASPSLANTDLRSLSLLDVLHVALDLAPALAELHVQGAGHGMIDLFTVHRGAGMHASAELDCPWPTGGPASPAGDIAALSRLVTTALARGGQRVPPAVSRVLEAATRPGRQRYRSVVGFARDLERCSDSLRRTGLCAPFEPEVRRLGLAWRDLERPVGLDAVLDTVMEAVGLGPDGMPGPRVVTVDGPSGIGRSTVLGMVENALRQRGVGVAATRFEAVEAQPMRAPLRLVRGIVDDLEVGPPDVRASVVAALRRRLGTDLGLAVALMPPLARLVGVVPAPAGGGALDMAGRVQNAAREVVAGMVDVVQPYVAVFDDADAADSGSLAMLSLLAGARIPLVLLLGRCTDRPAALDATLASLAGEDVDVRSVTVPPLGRADFHALVADGLGLDDGAAAALGGALWNRSGGNPGQAIADLHALIATRAVRVDAASGVWSWDDAALAGGAVSLVEADRRRVAALAPSALGVLQAVASAGSLGTPQVIAEALDLPADATIAALDRLATDHLVVWRDQPAARIPDGGVRQAAVESLESATSAQLRLRLARAVMATRVRSLGAPAVGAAERFELLQLLEGSEHALSADESTWYITWCEEAARLAHGGGAYAAALDLQLRAITQLGPVAWRDQPARMFELHLRAAENALVIDRTGLVDQLLDSAWAHHPTPMERVRAMRVLGNRWWTRQDQRGGIAEMQSLLRELGERFPTKPTGYHVARELMATRMAIRGMEPEQFVTAAPLRDELVRAKLDTMLSAVHLAYTTEPLTHVLLVLRGLRLTARHGVDASSAYFVAGYGLLMCGLGRQLELGVRYGRAGLALAERSDGMVRTMVEFAHHGFVRHWGEPLAGTVQPLLAEFRRGLAVGRGGYAHSAGAFAALHGLLAGQPLPDVVELTAELSTELLRLEEYAFAQRVAVVAQAAADLVGGLDGREPLCGEQFDAAGWLAARRRRGDLVLIVHTLQAHVALAHGRLEDAAGFVAAAAPHVRMAPGEVVVGVHHFQAALLEALGTEGAPRSRRSLVALRRAAAANPMDHRHRLAMVEAVGSAEHMAAAAVAARDHGHLADHALACLLVERVAPGGSWRAARAAALHAWGADGVEA
ncbi:MAG: AAA family ATPase [Acidimicrobiaceae bacterium]|nr:AAA family ATPase [Ilumatobacter sp.]MCB9381754.1 AAA family ATPase [Acidimicrobiaceae bacterium]MCO5329660.1 AAA family ATPase [Ilumatobacteraceae bacterium]